MLVTLLIAGCGAGDSGTGEAAVFQQGLTLAIDGASRVVPLESMDVWLTRDPSRPEAFEIRGKGVTIVGRLPLDARIDYSEDWHVLVGKTIPLKARGGDPAYEKPAILVVPGVGQFRVIGGRLVVEEIGTGPDGKTPISGRIELQVRAARGEMTLSGTFAVMAMTWG